MSIEEELDAAGFKPQGTRGGVRWYSDDVNFYAQINEGTVGIYGPQHCNACVDYITRGETLSQALERAAPVLRERATEATRDAEVAVRLAQAALLHGRP